VRVRSRDAGPPGAGGSACAEGTGVQPGRGTCSSGSGVTAELFTFLCTQITQLLLTGASGPAGAVCSFENRNFPAGSAN